jgi:hypothetical protein
VQERATTIKELSAMSDSQRNEHGQWETAELLRRATWPEVLLDRWIGPRSGHPWRSVLRGILGKRRWLGLLTGHTRSFTPAMRRRTCLESFTTVLVAHSKEASPHD